jgi:uncharacterized membrane protein YbhN (UPF0104 family)
MPLAPDRRDRPSPRLAYDGPAPGHVLPAFEGRALARRAALPAAVVAVGVVAVVVAEDPLRTFADALGRALGADPRWVAAAAAFELLSFAGYVALLWLVGSRASARLNLAASAEVTFGGAAATRLLPTGGVGGAALTIWALRRAGLGARQAVRTLLCFLVLLYAVFLASIALAGGAIALGLVDADGPPALSAVPAAGAASAMAIALVLAAVSRRRAAAPGVLLAIGAAVRDALGLLRSGDARLLGAPAWWVFDCAVLWAMLHALGAPPAIAIVVLAYFLGQVANTIPIPGAVSGGMVGVLLAFGVEADAALASVLAYRALAIWLPAPLGLVALGSLRRTVARWSADAMPDTEEGDRIPPGRAARSATPCSDRDYRENRTQAAPRRELSRSRGRGDVPADVREEARAARGDGHAPLVRGRRNPV